MASEVLETELVEVENDFAGQLARAEIDQQIATAKRYPRNIVEFRREALEMATVDEETAAGCYYSMPRAGKKIEGPSIRLAEIVAATYGNLRYSAQIVEIGATHVTARGMCQDMQRNIAAGYEVKRRITTKDGKRFGDDMIQTTCNAACSIALRNAIFKVVPMAYVKPIFTQAKRVAAGGAASLSESRQKALDWFKQKKVTEKQILELLGRKKVEEIDLDDLATLRGLVTAIEEGQTTVAETFDSVPGGKRARKSDLNEKAPPAADGGELISHDQQDALEDLIDKTPGDATGEILARYKANALTDLTAQQARKPSTR